MTDFAPNMIAAETDIYGNTIDTAPAMRWLNYIEGFLLLHATTDEQRELRGELKKWLNENCEHHWIAHEREEDYCEAHRQCLWCNDVEWSPRTGTERALQ